MAEATGTGAGGTSLHPRADSTTGWGPMSSGLYMVCPGAALGRRSAARPQRTDSARFRKWTADEQRCFLRWALLGTEAGTDLFENPLKWAFFDASPVPKHRFLMYRNGNS